MNFLIGIFVLLTSAFAYSQSRIISIDAFDLAYTGGLNFKHNEGRGSRDDENTTNFRLNLNYAQNSKQYIGLMWKGELNWNHEDVDFGSNDSQETAYGVAGGAVFNYQPDDIKNSFMAEALVGIERAVYEMSGLDESGINVFLELAGGKRFDLGRYSIANISYAPTISIMFKRYGGDIRDRFFTNGREVKLNFLKFDVIF